MIALCIFLWSLFLLLQACHEPKMLRFARLQKPAWLQRTRALRFVLPPVVLGVCVAERASTAIPVWVATFSVAALLVALGWSGLARYRELLVSTAEVRAAALRKE